MTNKNDGTESSRDKTSEEIDRILQKALKEPGVKELMDFYEKYEAVSRTVKPYQDAVQPKYVVFSTDCTGRPTDAG